MQGFFFYFKYLKNCGHYFYNYIKYWLPSKYQKHSMISTRVGAR